MVLVPGEGIFVDAVKELGFQVVLQEYSEKLARYGGAIYQDGLNNRWCTLRDWSKYFGRCRSCLQELRPAAVFCNDMRGLLTVGMAARWLGFPVMIWDKLDKPHGILDWFQLPIANCNVIISASVKTKYPRWQKWLYRNKIKHVPNGADIQRFDEGRSVRQELGISPGAVIIGIIGTVTYRKGHDRLLRILPNLVKKVPNVQILVVGSFEDSPEDRAFYDTLENRTHPCVRFLGQQDGMPDIMQTINVLAIPSRHEGMGQVTAEAMACGKPVIGANVGGIPEVVQHGKTGLIFEGDDEHGFLECLVRLATSVEDRIRMGEAGRQRAMELYNRSTQMKKICGYLKTLEHRSEVPGCQAP